MPDERARGFGLTAASSWFFLFAWTLSTPATARADGEIPGLREAFTAAAFWLALIIAGAATLLGLLIPKIRDLRLLRTFGWLLGTLNIGAWSWFSIFQYANPFDFQGPAAWVFLNEAYFAVMAAVLGLMVLARLVWLVHVPSAKFGSSFAFGLVWAAAATLFAIGIFDFSKRATVELGEHSAELINLDTRTSSRVSTPTYLAHSGMAKVGEELLFVGGLRGEGYERDGERIATTWFFNPKTRDWRSGPPLHTPRCSPKAVSLSGGRVLVHPGTCPIMLPIPDDLSPPVEILERGGNAWRPISELTWVRDVVELADGRIVVSRGGTKLHVWTPGDGSLQEIPSPLDEFRTDSRGIDKNSPFTTLADGRVAALAIADKKVHLRVLSACPPPATDCRWETITSIPHEGTWEDPAIILPSGELRSVLEIGRSDDDPGRGDSLRRELWGTTRVHLPRGRVAFIGGSAWNARRASDEIRIWDRDQKKFVDSWRMNTEREKPHAAAIDDGYIFVLGGQVKKLPEVTVRELWGIAVLLFAWLLGPVLGHRRLIWLPFGAGAIAGVVLVLSIWARELLQQLFSGPG